MVRKLTSASANKLLKTLRDRLQLLDSQESARYIYTEIEGSKPVIPEYDIEKTNAEIKALMKQIMHLKHAINVFNTRTEISSLGMTIDSVLIRMSQLNKLKDRYDKMRKTEKKVVKTDFAGRSGNKVEYSVANYDPAIADKYYVELVEEINRIQLELDLVNSTVTFDYDDETGMATYQ